MERQQDDQKEADTQMELKKIQRLLVEAVQEKDRGLLCQVENLAEVLGLAQDLIKASPKESLILQPLEKRLDQFFVEEGKTFLRYIKKYGSPLFGSQGQIVSSKKGLCSRDCIEIQGVWKAIDPLTKFRKREVELEITSRLLSLRSDVFRFFKNEGWDTYLGFDKTGGEDFAWDRFNESLTWKMILVVTEPKW